MLAEERLYGRTAERARGGGIPLTPRGDALLAIDVAALESHRMVVLLLADGAAVLAQLEHLLGARILAYGQVEKEDGSRRRARALHAVDERDELKANVQV